MQQVEFTSRDAELQNKPSWEDADGWIEWKGGECPVDHGVMIDVRYRDGVVRKCMPALEPVADYHDVMHQYWQNDGVDGDIIAYRLHKPEIAPSAQEPEPMPVPEDKPTIEQLSAGYRNAKDYALRLQEEANDAWTASEKAKGELIDAGKALGLVLSVVEPELVTTKFTGKFHSAKYGDRPSDLDMICDGCGKRFGYHVGFDCRP